MKKRTVIKSPPHKPKRWKGADIRKAGGYGKYYESLKQFKLSSNKIGRNEKCPCGSERKYKKCCL